MLQISSITAGGKPVQGIGFSSQGGAQDTSGSTEVDGKFNYAPNSQIQLSIGSTIIGTVQATDLKHEGTLSIKSLEQAYTGDDPVIRDLSALLLMNADPTTGQLRAPSDLATLNPVKQATLLVNGKPAANAKYMAMLDPTHSPTRKLILVDGTTDNVGVFNYDPLSKVIFKVGDVVIGTIAGSAMPETQTVTIEALLAANNSSAANPSLSQLPTLLLEEQSSGAKHYLLPEELASLDPLRAMILTLGGKPVSGVAYNSGVLSGITSQNGIFEQDADQDIHFSVAGIDLGAVTRSALPTSIEALVNASESSYPVLRHLPELLSKRNDPDASNPTAGFRLHDLEQQLLKPERLPDHRVLGMNLETPQAESDHINQPLLTPDIFRVSRPFAETSCKDIIYTDKGWPKEIPETCQQADTAHGESKYAFTRILQFAPGLSFPEGPYTVLYDGTGNISYSGMGCNVQRVAPGHDLIDVKVLNTCPNPSNLSGTNSNYKNNRGLEISITATDPKDPVRNIRVIMPGGICKGNPFKRVNSALECAAGKQAYISFVELLKHNRNTIVFNPDFLNFAKDFRTLRMMNLMEASPRRPAANVINPCPDSSEVGYEACVLQAANWDKRPTMDSPHWGGSYKTSVLKRHGVPLEFAIALANQLQAHPWFTIPHNADDAFVTEYATLLANELDEKLIAHIEYSNEVWNGGFWAHHYVQAMGHNDAVISAMEDLPYRDKNYSVRIRYYAKRATEIFKMFEAEFADNSRLKRILGSKHKFHALSNDLLNYADTQAHTDAIAIAPYFHGCWSRQFKNGAGDTLDHSICSNTETVPLTFSEIVSLDQVFDIINGSYDMTQTKTELRGDPDNLSATIQLLNTQLDVAKAHGVELYAYEGGAHLALQWGDTLLSDAKKNSLWDFFAAANRDSRMGAYYTKLLNAWKEAGGKQFMLFSAPQSYNRYGFFGIKEHLGKTRSESPKYDAALSFQEALTGCWPGFVETGC